MPAWTEPDLQQQLDRAIASGWIAFFQNAAAAHDFPLELLLGIASRETDMQNVKGDKRNGVYHGYGIMQVDIGTDPAFCAAWTPDNVDGSIQRGTQILAGKRTSLARGQVTDLRAIVAAYNAGEGNVLRAVHAGQDPDSVTAHGNYGADVLNRMAVFTRLRAPAAAG